MGIQCLQVKWEIWCSENMSSIRTHLTFRLPSPPSLDISSTLAVNTFSSSAVTRSPTERCKETADLRGLQRWVDELKYEIRCSLYRFGTIWTIAQQALSELPYVYPSQLRFLYAFPSFPHCSFSQLNRLIHSPSSEQAAHPRNLDDLMTYFVARGSRGGDMWHAIGAVMSLFIQIRLI